MEKTLFAYGLSHRGCSIGTQPAGCDHFEDTDKATTGFYSVVYYAEELTPDQISAYELTPITEQPATQEEKDEPITVKDSDDLAAMIDSEGLLQVAYWMLKGHDNCNLIMLAGIEAGIFTAADLDNYLFEMRTPNYHTFNE